MACPLPACYSITREFGALIYPPEGMTVGRTKKGSSGGIDREEPRFSQLQDAWISWVRSHDECSAFDQLSKEEAGQPLFNFRDGLRTRHWGSGTAVEESYDGLFNPSLPFPPGKSCVVWVVI